MSDGGWDQMWEGGIKREIQFYFRITASYLLRVVFLVWEQRRDMEHDLNTAPVGVNGIQSRQVVHCVQPTLVLVETCNTHIQILYNTLFYHVFSVSPSLVRLLGDHIA
jgi:hypothetical protein